MHRIAIDLSQHADVPATLSEPGAALSDRAVDQLLRCSRACADAASRIEDGLADAEPERIRLLLACAEACRATAHVMILGVPQLSQLCEACGAICEACAENCAEDPRLRSFAALCQASAKACRTAPLH